MMNAVTVKDITPAEAAGLHFDAVYNPLEITDEYRTISIEMTDIHGITRRVALLFYTYDDLQNKVLIEESRVLILQQGVLFEFSYPTAELTKWVDPGGYIAVYFGIFPKDENYIIHGEGDIIMLNSNLQPVWDFSGHDIFATADASIASFQMKEDRISLVDFDLNRYELGYDGQLISMTKA